MNKQNIAIVQARIGSSRLPGKMFKKLGRYYLIEWVIMRLKKSKQINKIILATTKKKYKKFLNICKKFNIIFFLEVKMMFWVVLMNCKKYTKCKYYKSLCG